MKEVKKYQLTIPEGNNEWLVTYENLSMKVIAPTYQDAKKYAIEQWVKQSTISDEIKKLLKRSRKQQHFKGVKTKLIRYGKNMKPAENKWIEWHFPKKEK